MISEINKMFYIDIDNEESARAIYYQSQLKMEISAPNEDAKDSVEPVKQVLALGAPFPMVVLPVDGEFWMEGTYHILSRDMEDRPLFPQIDMSRCTVNEETGVLDYRRHFAGKEHMNFAGVDDKHGPVLLSARLETSIQNEEQYRVLLRLKNKTYDKIIPTSSMPVDLPGPRDFMKKVLEESEVEVERFHHVCLPRISDDIIKFDEHTLSNCYKVGIVAQHHGQTTEEEYLQNQGESPAFTEFLDLLAQKVDLKEFPNYRGGLDVKYGQTGDHSYYTEFKERELMFHVSTLLPYAPKDLQQLGRKRHIGNDVVTIIFQEENTPFCPSSIRSHFLHVFIIIQVEEPNTENTRYKVSITSKEGVPKFAPSLPSPCVFKKGPEFREFLLTKIINAEMAAVKSEKFSQLAERTRSMLLQSLVGEFINKTKKLLEEDSCTTIQNNNNNNDDSASKGSSILSSFRSALNRTNRSGSINSNGAHSVNSMNSEVYTPHCETINGHSLSLNDLTSLSVEQKNLTSLSVEQKKDPKRQKKERKQKKEKSCSMISPRSVSPTPRHNRLNTDLGSSGEISPVLRHPDSYRSPTAVNKPKSRSFTNQLFDGDTFTQTQSLPQRLNPTIMNGATSPPVSPLRITKPILSLTKTRKDDSNSESNSEPEESENLACAQSEIEKLKAEINKLKVDKMDLTRQNIFHRQHIQRLNERSKPDQESYMGLRRDAYNASFNSMKQFRKLHGAFIATTETEYV